MGIQCFLFSSDSASADAIRQVLAELDVQAESCPEAVAAVDKIAKQPFQIVIIDWDQQPEAGLLLTAARDRKASERPINLAIVSDDASVPKALQAGANSILRRPLIPSQVKDTLRTARDLIQSRLAPATALTNAPSSASLLPLIAPREKGGEHALRAGEFLQSAPLTPGTSFETEGDVRPALDQPSPEPVNPLKDLEPVAASVVQEKPAPVPPSPPADGETRGLEWYLKARGVTRQAAAAQPARAPASDKPELLGYDQTSSTSSSGTSRQTNEKDTAHEETKKEAALFAYIEGEQPESEGSSGRFRLGKKAIFAAFVLASVAIAAAPQAPWHPQMRALWAHGQRAVHGLLNPQLVITKQAPTTHEDFGRAGDEYKLPVAETIPDATTDPSQIEVLPVIDPTAKKPNTDAAPANQTSAPPDPSVPAPADQGTANPAPGTGGQQVPVVIPAGQPATPTAPTTNPSNSQPAPVVPAPVVTTPTPVLTPAPTTAKPTASIPKQAPVQYTPVGNIPSSLKSQLAPSGPDPVGPKVPGGAAAAIEPVAVGENAERALISYQPIIPYPATAKGQQGTVILQILIGRDGTVQDAKFLQGSLAFANAAITGVRQWKFKPYILNGRPVSVQTLLTMTFTPSTH
ncbi:MAG TPA: TonB family protein [Candidatus Sulfotelmatobacter sp.]|nr:TonB family protein [Candidatus Sulfotelmatobacter sp.]